MPALVRQGVKLGWERAGQGEPALVFVHGWCCDRSYFAPQSEHFRDRHQVVSVDLRGHGASDAPEQPYSIQGFADDVAWLCDELGVAGAVAIGHSMGGVVAAELARQRPELVRALVFVDSPLVPPPAVAGAARAMAVELRGADAARVAREFVLARLFHPADDPARAARIADAMSARPRHVMASAFETLFDYDAAPALAAFRVPILNLSAAEPPADLARIRQLAPHTTFAQTAAAGHFCQLEVPEQVNAMIERFLRANALG
jgi:pimeloyl-ACP methyl ester carboxylesterase